MASLFDELGGEKKVRALAMRFYEQMHATEPELTALHLRDPDGKVTWHQRDRFASFLIAWLGGPQEYFQLNGKMTLDTRHRHVKVDPAMRDAWMRAMRRALDGAGLAADLRARLDARFAEAADALLNSR